MTTGRTNQSATLRSKPDRNSDFLDRLEPGYPLVIHGQQGNWLDVTAKAQGIRTKDQRGWISGELVTVAPAVSPVAQPMSPLTVIGIGAGLGFLILLALAAYH